MVTHSSTHTTCAIIADGYTALQYSTADGLSTAAATYTTYFNARRRLCSWHNAGVQWSRVVTRGCALVTQGTLAFGIIALQYSDRHGFTTAAAAYNTWICARMCMCSLQSDGLIWSHTAARIRLVRSQRMATQLCSTVLQMASAQQQQLIPPTSMQEDACAAGTMLAYN